MKLPLRWRIALTYTVLLILSLGGLGLTLHSYQNQYFLLALENQLFSEARLISGQVSPLIEAGSPYTSLEDAVIQLSGLINARITVILKDGTVIAESSQPASALENHLSRPEVQQALKGKEDSESRFSTTTGQQMLYAAIPYKSSGVITAVIRLSVPQTYVVQNQRVLGKIVLVAFPTVAGLAILLAILLTSYITRPLQSLTGRVQSLGHLESHPARKQDALDEIQLLSRSFDALSSQLTTQITALQNERGTLQSVLSTMTDGVIMVDENDHVVLINPAALRLFHLEEADAIHHSIVEVVRNHQVVDTWRKCKSSQAPQNMTLELTAEHLYLQVIATPMAQVGPDIVLLVFQDLTRVRRLETVRQDFVSNVSHELRTPLASLKALSETLQDGALEDPPAAHRFLTQMENEIDNLTQMVQELLELSRIESGKVPLARKPVPAGQLLEEAAGRMSLQAERAGLTLTVEMPDIEILVLVDAGRIAQVLLNLLHNAIKFTPPGGHIWLKAAPRAFDVAFSIKDTGVGIAPNDLTRIFERFYKTDRSRSGGGTGLGLSIARHLVEAHGGRIWAESVLQEGSTFYFTIPRAS